MREGRGFGRIDRDGANPTVGDAAQQLREAFEVHRLVKAVIDGFLDQRMIGNADVAGQVFGAGGLIREDRRHQIVRAHALDGRRNFASARET